MGRVRLRNFFPVSFHQKYEHFLCFAWILALYFVCLVHYLLPCCIHWSALCLLCLAPFNLELLHHTCSTGCTCSNCILAFPYVYKLYIVMLPGIRLIDIIMCMRRNVAAIFRTHAMENLKLFNVSRWKLYTNLEYTHTQILKILVHFTLDYITSRLRNDRCVQ